MIFTEFGPKKKGIYYEVISDDDNNDQFCLHHIYRLKLYSYWSLKCLDSRFPNLIGGYK